MKRFKVEHKDMEKPTMYITLFNPPYENEDVISKTGDILPEKQQAVVYS